jgi:hypothetical protein
MASRRRESPPRYKWRESDQKIHTPHWDRILSITVIVTLAENGFVKSVCAGAEFPRFQRV